MRHQDVFSSGGWDMGRENLGDGEHEIPTSPKMRLILTRIRTLVWYEGEHFRGLLSEETESIILYLKLGCDSQSEETPAVEAMRDLLSIEYCHPVSVRRLLVSYNLWAFQCNVWQQVFPSGFTIKVTDICIWGRAPKRKSCIYRKRATIGCTLLILPYSWMIIPGSRSWKRILPSF